METYKNKSQAFLCGFDIRGTVTEINYDTKEKTKRDNNLLNNCVRYLANLYEVKRNKFRGKDPQKFDMYEAKYKEFDALQNSFGN